MSQNFALFDVVQHWSRALPTELKYKFSSFKLDAKINQVNPKYDWFTTSLHFQHHSAKNIKHHLQMFSMLCK